MLRGSGRRAARVIKSGGASGSAARRMCGAKSGVWAAKSSATKAKVNDLRLTYYDESSSTARISSRQADELFAEALHEIAELPTQDQTRATALPKSAALGLIHCVGRA